LWWWCEGKRERSRETVYIGGQICTCLYALPIGIDQLSIYLDANGPASFGRTVVINIQEGHQVQRREVDHNNSTKVHYLGMSIEHHESWCESQRGANHKTATLLTATKFRNQYEHNVTKAKCKSASEEKQDQRTWSLCDGNKCDSHSFKFPLNLDKYFHYFIKPRRFDSFLQVHATHLNGYGRNLTLNLTTPELSRLWVYEAILALGSQLEFANNVHTLASILHLSNILHTPTPK